MRSPRYQALAFSLAILVSSVLSGQSTIYDIFSGANDGAEDLTAGNGVVEGSGATDPADFVEVSTSFSLSDGTSVSQSAYFANRDVSWTSEGLGGSSAGSGVFTKMFGISGNTDSVKGFNESASEIKNRAPKKKDLNYDQDSGVGLPTTVIKDVSVVRPLPAQQNGSSPLYLEILYDGNESGKESGISLDTFIVFVAPGHIAMSKADEKALGNNPSQGEVINFFRDSGAEILYSLDSLDSSGAVAQDNTVLFETSNGSGRADAGFYIPLSDVRTLTGNNDDYQLYFWIEQGGLGTYNTTGGSGSGHDFGNSGGGEEWAYWKDGTSVAEATVPEAGTTVSGLLLASMLGCGWWRSKHRKLAD